MAEAHTGTSRLGSEATRRRPRHRVGRAEQAGPVQVPAAAVEYPDNDGMPMESLRHYFAGVYAVTVLIRYFGSAMHFGANNGVYYKEGDPRSVVVPDVYAVTGKPQTLEDTYLVWEQGLPPDFVLELASKSTFVRDKVVKRDIYAGMGVQDYFMFDPTGKYLDEPLQGARLSKNKPPKGIEPARLADGGMSLHSEVLNLELRAWRGDTHPILRFFDPATERYLASAKEANAEAERRREDAERQREEAESRREEAERQQQEADQTIAALRSRLAALEAKQGN